MKFRGFIFDVDATLASTNELIFTAFRHVTNKYLGRKFSDDEIVSYFGPTEDELIQDMFGDKWKVALEDYYRYYDSEHDKLAAIYPGIIDVLKTIKSKDIPLSIFTGKGRKTAEITLEKIGVRRYFDLIVSGNDIEGSKPSREGVDLFINKFKLNRKEVIIIGDAPADILAARNSGIKGGSALWESYKYNEMINLGNDFEFHSVDELKEFVIQFT